jgi:hypothetical protein
MVLGLYQLLITLIKMIVHGHENEEFVEYSNEFQPNDLNFMIELLQLLWALKKELVSESRILFEFKPQNSFFWQLMQGSSHYVHSLKVIDKFIGAKPLPIKLLLLMDNFVKELKNDHLHSYFS